MAGQNLDQFPNIWGVFNLDGSAAFDVDSFQSAHPEDSTKVPNFPVEDGGFVNYDKVINPTRCRVRLAVGGDSQRIETFITAARAAVKALTLFNIATPEQTYMGLNAEKMSIARNLSGANLVVADMDFIEIRQVQPQYSTVILPAAKTKKKGTSDQTQEGKQQAQTPSKTPITKLPWNQLWGRSGEDLAGG